jgi:hypothetical protein
MHFFDYFCSFFFYFVFNQDHESIPDDVAKKLTEAASKEKKGK